MKTREVKTPETWLKTAETLSEALPYMREFAGETFVVKYGGHAMGDQREGLDWRGIFYFSGDFGSCNAARRGKIRTSRAARESKSPGTLG